MNRKELAKYIDHTNLKAFATREDIKRLCDEAKEYGFYAVCVNPYRVKDAAEFLKGTDIKIASVVGFPLGATFTETKVQEAIMTVRNGADEIDMVMNIGAMKDGDYGFVERDIREVVEAVHPMGAKVKVIIETCYLSDEEKIKACELAKKAGADFVKTSTGFGTAGAKVEDVKLMRSVVGNDMGVKAAGGIHNAKEAIAMIEAGATRIGASRSVQIIETLELI
ncbi:deoxyribose-phosphate aldolase [Aciduliprofundum boonei T469]|nr:deoxyribose-phosphate aldolase [Aciduliprofundum boonei T469]